MVKVVVVGAGVIGLTSAYRLLQEGHEVSIIAQHLPGDQNIEYTSPKAGAFYIPLTKRSDTDKRKEYDLMSYKEVFKLHDTRVESGILKVKARVLVDITEKKEAEEYIKYGGPWWKDVVDGFRILDSSEFPTKKILFGFEYDSFVITPVHYLHFLLFECIKMGLRYRRHTITKLADALSRFIEKDGSFGKGDLVINCTGIGSRQLVPEDTKQVAIKGQTILVENNVPFLTAVDIKDPDFPDETVYVIPRREGGTLINGIYSYHNNSTHLDDDLTQRIMKRLLIYAPELVDTNYKDNPTHLKIVSHNIGIRPGRFESPRVEFEKVDGVNCIHNYGSGSSGYIQSFGVCQIVIDLINKYYSGSKL